MAEVVIPYRRRAVQREFHAAIAGGAKHVVLVWHRRAGKTVALVNELVRSALACPRPNARFVYVAPYLKQAKTLAWDYLRQYTEPVPGREINASELSVEFPNGARVRLFGADNPDALRGIYLDGVVLDEFGQIPRLLRLEVLLPALADRGGWEVVCGTPKGRNQFYYLFHGDDDTVGAVNDPAWVTFVRKASETGILPRATLDHLLKQMGPELYAQELECAWNVADRGSFFGKQLEEARAQRRITRVPLDKGLPVHTAWDLGIGDATSIWFVQKLGPEVRAVDFYEAEGEPLEHYVKMLAGRGYLYGKHFVPHDADHRSLQTGKTLVEMASRLGVKMTVVPIGDFNAGIEAARQVMGRAWFDAEKCKAGLSALDAYRKVYNARMDEHTSDPVHDWASHASDAWRTFAMAELGNKLSPHMFGGKRTQFAKM